jgi:hypothetical protein
MLAFVAELAASGAAVEFPINFDAVPIRAAVPALASAFRIFRLGMRRFPRHCRENSPISISA